MGIQSFVKFVKSPFFVQGAGAVAFLLGGVAILKTSQEIKILNKKASKESMTPEEAERILRRHNISKDTVVQEFQIKMDPRERRMRDEMLNAASDTDWKQVRIPRSNTELTEIKRIQQGIQSNIEKAAEIERGTLKNESDAVKLVTQGVVNGIKASVDEWMKKSEMFLELVKLTDKKKDPTKKIEVYKTLMIELGIHHNAGYTLSLTLLKYRNIQLESPELGEQLKELADKVSKMNLKVKQELDSVFEKSSEVHAEIMGVR